MGPKHLCGADLRSLSKLESVSFKPRIVQTFGLIRVDFENTGSV